MFLLCHPFVAQLIYLHHILIPAMGSTFTRKGISIIKRRDKQNWENKQQTLPSLLVLNHPAFTLPPQQNLPGSLPKKNQLSPPLCFYSPLYVVALYAPVYEPDPLIC